MTNDWLGIAGYVVAAVLLVYGTRRFLAGTEEKPETKTAANNSSPTGGEVKPLVVGREYMIRDSHGDWRRLVYFGKYQDGRHEFANLETGAGCSMLPKDRDTANLFRLGDVRWLETQSELDCPKVEEDK